MKDNIKTRVLSVLQYGILGFGPIGLWLSGEIFQNHTVGSRQIVMDGSFIEKLIVVGKKIIEVTKYWLPYRTHMIHGVNAEVLSPILLAFFLSIVVLGFLSYFLLRRKTKSINRTPFILTFGFIMLFIFYLLFVISANIFTGMASIQDRILSPILPMTFVILLSSLWMIGQYTKIKTPVIWICSLIIVFFFVKYDYSQILRSTIEYEDVTPAWVDRPIFEVIRKMNIEKADLVFSNGPDIVLYYSNVYPYYLTKTMASTGGVELSLGGESTLDKCQIYLLFPPDFIDRIQRQEDRIDDETILNLQTAFQTYYSGSDGLILVNDSCGSEFQ